MKIKTLPTLVSLNISLALLIGAMLAPISFTGCAWLKPSSVAEGSDSVVVGAEQTAKLAMSYTSEFLKWEWINRGTVGADVTKLADSVRGEFPKSYGDLRAATKAYKASRSQANKTALENVLVTIDTLIARVQARLPESVKAKAEAAAKQINLK